jgi:pentatricopeptide repeat protein
MAGKSACYDVFISYCADSDAHHAERIYNELMAAGVTAW